MAEKDGLTRLEIALAEADRAEAEIADEERRKDEQEIDRLADVLFESV